MKKHRALWVIIIVIVVLAAAAAGVWFWLQSRLDETQQAHQTVYAEYQAMTAAADQVTLTVTEDGSAIGSYDMQALGLRDDLLQKVNAQFSELDRMPDAQFAALPLKERLGEAGAQAGGDCVPRPWSAGSFRRAGRSAEREAHGGAGCIY